MARINTLIINGNLGGIPEQKTENMYVFSLAHNTTEYNKETNENIDKVIWIDVTVTNKSMFKYIETFEKGDHLILQGTLVIKEYNGKSKIGINCHSFNSVNNVTYKEYVEDGENSV